MWVGSLRGGDARGGGKREYEVPNVRFREPFYIRYLLVCGLLLGSGGCGEFVSVRHCTVRSLFTC